MTAGDPAQKTTYPAPSFSRDRNPFALTVERIDRFLENRHYRPCRKQLQILIVEDQAFSQKLMAGILAGAGTGASMEQPIIDVAQGVRDAWEMYLRKAHHIVFVDLVLPDGSGHALARAIKELDPRSCVIIVTANDYQEEMAIARRNDVDGFVSKPYKKNQILEYIERYIDRLSTPKGRSDHEFLVD